MVFLNIVVPVFIVFGAGYLVQKLFHLELRSLSTTIIYILSPFLAFKTFYEADLNMDTFYLVIYAFSLTIVLLALIYAYSRIRKHSTEDYCALVLGTVFMNAGNYGVPVALFAFGDAGLHTAVILMVIQSLSMSTVGIYFAAKGGDKGEKLAPWRRVLKIPIAYGALLGVGFNSLSLSLPETLERPVNLISDATIPMVMLLLGMQLANITLKNMQIEKVTVAVVARLFISPLIALVLIWILPVSGMVAKVILLIAAMPTAANTTIYALQFNTKPNIVTSTTLLSTLLSVVTIPVLIHLLL
ncbi:putative permease [Pullulanibacillus pueri]|uniref:Membrane protein n=1 Tax=Pullulanibacillus pueri TaxID=1437324 RepID=A0A8J2ZTA1_9BACL|nr:AEC family transporter [Pullulanibacillus pueri]MBM7680460.1 putative permease [Pullulanibacillus pueri]GGH74978.1 membrane protein [Pullulanibacillus pueri]